MKPLHEKLTDTEAAAIGRRFVEQMRKAERMAIDNAELIVTLVSLFDDAREWAGETVKQRRASLGGAHQRNQVLRRAA